MNKEWVEQKNRSRKNKQQRLLAKIKKKFTESGLFEEAEVAHLIRSIKTGLHDPRFALTLDHAFVGELAAQKYGTGPEHSDERARFALDCLRVKRELNQTFTELFETLNDFSRYQDSEPVDFDGNIIITDPCYFMKDDDWGRDGLYGSHLERYGIQHYMTRDTIYGDWSCTVFDADDNEKELGQFCADAGLVTVASLDEVLKYNPDFNYHETKPWTATVIRDFKGTVQFIVKEVKYVDAGERYTDYEVRVAGHGVNKSTGEPINFVSSQTGL